MSRRLQEGQSPKVPHCWDGTASAQHIDTLPDRCKHYRTRVCILCVRDIVYEYTLASLRIYFLMPILDVVYIKKILLYSHTHTHTLLCAACMKQVEQNDERGRQQHWGRGWTGRGAAMMCRCKPINDAGPDIQRCLLTALPLSQSGREGGMNSVSIAK